MQGEKTYVADYNQDRVVDLSVSIFDEQALVVLC